MLYVGLLLPHKWVEACELVQAVNSSNNDTLTRDMLVPLTTNQTHSPKLAALFKLRDLPASASLMLLLPLLRSLATAAFMSLLLCFMLLLLACPTTSLASTCRLGGIVF